MAEAPRDNPMTNLRLLGANSVIYTATNLLQKGTAFLLMPLYTLYLGPAEYGVLAIVTAVNGFLSLAFTLNLSAAVTRFYFEYQDDPKTLSQFWGSILCFVILLSLAVGGLLLAVGEKLLHPFIGSVPFWPYVAIGVVTTFFQPFFTMFLAVLQTRNQAGRYALISLAHFVLTTVLTVALIVFVHFGVTGALVAALVATAIFFLVSLWLMRTELTPCLLWCHLRPALGYSLPQVPHLLACQTIAIADRVILNGRIGPAAVGLYSVGGMIAMVVDVAASSLNRAFVPMSMSALRSRDPVALTRIQAVGSLVVAGFCLLGAFAGAFGRELLLLLTRPQFAVAAPIIPLLAFGGVAGAIYYLFVNVLFFERSATKLLPIGSMIAAMFNVTLALSLVPSFGLVGAATANLLSQIMSTSLMAVLARRYDPIRWEYGRYAMAFVCGLGCALMLVRLDAGSPLATIVLKIGGHLALAFMLGLILWRRPFIFADAMVLLLRRQPGEAAALFVTSNIGSTLQR